MGAFLLCIVWLIFDIDAFVNSHEWTLSNNVPHIKLVSSQYQQLVYFMHPRGFLARFTAENQPLYIVTSRELICMKSHRKVDGLKKRFLWITKVTCYSFVMREAHRINSLANGLMV